MTSSKKRVIKRSLCIVVAALTLLASPGLNAFAADAGGQRGSYPIVFVHGLNGWGGGEGLNRLIPYWGATTGDLMTYLEGEGYECYSASVGPVSSAWDRACELYAQLTGTTVDYGEAHSSAHNHARYGRTYDKPLFEGWGEEDAGGRVKKVHLVGHSFGGTTIRLMVNWLTYGCEEEVKASGDDVSPLFTGGKEGLVQSVTTICTPHNSSSLYKLVEDSGLYNVMLVVSALYCGALGRSALNGRLVDFHLEQFGLTNTPGKRDAGSYVASVIRILKNSDDVCIHDLLPENAQTLNESIKISPNVYYYSYAFDSTFKSSLTGLTWPIPSSNPLITLFGIWISHRREFTCPETGQVFDDEWRPNDLLCNTVSEKYPFTEPHTDYDPGSVSAGVWNVMPVQKGDHGTAIGLLADKTVTHEFYSSLAAMLAANE